MMAQEAINKCAECGAVLAPSDEKCRYCGVANPDWDGTVSAVSADGTGGVAPAKPLARHAYKGVIIIIALVLGFRGVVYLHVAAQEATQQHWMYDTITNVYRGNDLYEARVLALHDVDLAQPTLGGKLFSASASPVYLEIGYKQGEPPVVTLKLLEPGLSAAHRITGNVITVNFDSIVAVPYQVTDAFPDYLINQPDKFITRLRESHTLTISASFEKAGVRTMEFNTSNLVWDYDHPNTKDY